MEDGVQYRQRQVEEYKSTLAPLFRYVPWLEQSAGKSASRSYSGSDNGAQSMSFPVYDGTLLSFVRDAGKTSLMDRNYRYIYTRNHIRNHDDERRLIREAGIKEWDILCGILSNYVLGGRTKGILWSEGVQESIFYLVIKQMMDIIDYWDKTLKVH